MIHVASINFQARGPKITTAVAQHRAQVPLNPQSSRRRQKNVICLRSKTLNLCQIITLPKVNDRLDGYKTCTTFGSSSALSITRWHWPCCQPTTSMPTLHRSTCWMSSPSSLSSGQWLSAHIQSSSAAWSFTKLLSWGENSWLRNN